MLDVSDTFKLQSCFSSSILVFSLPLFLFLSLWVSTGSLSCTRSHPPRSLEAGLSAPSSPLGGSWYIFGPVSLDTSPTVRSIPSTLKRCPSHTSTLCHHLFLLHISSSQLLPCHVAITDIWAHLLFLHSSPPPQVVLDCKDGVPLLSQKYFPVLPLCP